MKWLHRNIAPFLSYLVLSIGVVFLIVSFLSRFSFLGDNAVTITDISSVLKETIDVAELSTAEYKYKGIADIYADDDQTILCRACYYATVKAGIILDDMVYLVDEDQKTITASLPEIQLKVAMVDEHTLTLLPHDANVELSHLLRCCKADVENEVRESKELTDIAHANLQSAIEGWVYPVVNAYGYSFVWSDSYMNELNGEMR